MEYSGFEKKDPKALMEEIKHKAELFVPEWKPDPESPDLGTMLAMLFADMLSETGELFSEAVSRYPLRLYHMIGAEPLPPGEAEGYVVFCTVNDEVQGSYVDRKTRLSGSAGKEKSIPFDTEQDVFVSPARLTEIVYADGKKDVIALSPPLPLNEKALVNVQSHFFYIGHAFLFEGMTEGEILLDFCSLTRGEGAAPDPADMDGISWSYLAGEGFVPFEQYRYENGRLHLYKKRETDDFSRQGEEKNFWLRAEKKKMKPGEEIVFPPFSIRSAGQYIKPELIYDGNTELDGESFLPFGSKPYLYQEIYFGSDEVFSKKGARITLSFDLQWEEFPGEYEISEPAVQWKSIMRSSDFPKTRSADTKITFISLEYYNGLGFTRIPGTKDCGGILGKEEGRIRISFLCPPDICPSLVSAKEIRSIRLRVLELSNPYPINGVYRVPRFSDCLLEYRYEEAGELPGQVFAENQLEIKRLECGREGIPFFQPFPAARMLYLAFTRPLDEEAVSLLFLMGEKSGEEEFSCRYEYYGKKGWEPLHALDGTGSFSETGILSFVSAHAFVKKELFRHEGYWMRILWEGKEGTDAMPPVTGIFLNAAAVRAAEGSGSAGNLPIQSLWTPERNIGFVNKITNPDSIAGGYDREETAGAALRSAAALRHGGRAVMTGDFEDIVRGALRNILRVKCFSGRNGRGEKAPGHITLAVLTKEEDTQFERIRKKILDCLRPYTDAELLAQKRLHIVRAERIVLKIRVALKADASAKKGMLREEVKKRIDDFLDPVRGNFDKKGWEIGTLPAAVQIVSVCEQMEGVLGVSHIGLDWEKEGGIYALAAGGKHEIRIETEVG